jgi:hypothetical protein
MIDSTTRGKSGEVMLGMNVIGETDTLHGAKRGASEGCVALRMNGANDVIHHDQPCRVAQQDLKAEPCRSQVETNNWHTKRRGILVHGADNARNVTEYEMRRTKSRY